MLTIPRSECDLICGAGKGSGGEGIAVAGAIGAGVGVSGSIATAGGLSALSSLGASICGAAFAGVFAAGYAGVVVGRAIGENEWVRGRLSDMMLDWGG